jgi:O-antigen/teichoic acid export membrane protein
MILRKNSVDNFTELAVDRVNRADSRLLRVGLFKNSALMMVCRIAAMLVMLATTPFIIGKLGLLGYGSWEVLLSISTITTIFQNTLGGTLLWRVSSAYGLGDESEIRRLPRLGIAVTLSVFAVSFPTVLVFRHSLVQLFHIPAELCLSAVVILPCIIGISVLGGLNESLASVLRGSQEAGYTSVIQTLAGFLNAGILLFGLSRGNGLWSLLAGYAAAALATGIGYYLRVFYLYGWFNIFPKLPTWQDVTVTRRYMGLLSFGFFSSLLRGETDKLVLAGFATPAWVGVYAIAARMASLVMESSNFFYTPTVAATGAMNGRGDWQGVKSLYVSMAAVFPVAAGLMSVLVLSLYDRLTVFWLGRSVPQIAPILYLVVAGNAIAVILTGSGTSICKGLGKLEAESIYVLTSLILNIILTIVLVLTIGAIGTVIASTVSWAIGSLLFLILMHRRFDLPLKGTYRSIGALLYLAAVVAVARFLIPDYGSDPNRLKAFLSALKFGTPIAAVFLLPFIFMNAKAIKKRVRPFFYCRTGSEGKC